MRARSRPSSINARPPSSIHAIDPRSERIGRNEALFREVNERVERLTHEFQVTDEDLELLCECGDPSCHERIALPLSEYEALRADSTTFAVKPGHEAPEAETVVRHHDRYLVIRKHPGEPAELAAELDERT